MKSPLQKRIGSRAKSFAKLVFGATYTRIGAVADLTASLVLARRVIE